MAVELQIQLTESADGQFFTLGVGEILRVFTDTLGSNVLYYKHGRRRAVTVTEIPDKVAGLAKSLISVTDTDSVVQYINADFIILIDSRNDGVAGSIIKYDMKGARPTFITVSQTKGAINKAVYEAAGNTGYTILSTNVTNKTFTLVTGDGNVTGTFTAGKMFSVIDSAGNDGSYEVASSTFASSSTTITVKEAISDGGDDGEILIVTQS